MIDGQWQVRYLLVRGHKGNGLTYGKPHFWRFGEYPQITC